MILGDVDVGSKVLAFVVNITCFKYTKNFNMGDIDFYEGERMFASCGDDFSFCRRDGL